MSNLNFQNVVQNIVPKIIVNKFIAVMYSTNKYIPIAYEVLVGEDELNEFIKIKRLSPEDDDDCEQIAVSHNGEEKFLEIKRYNITDKTRFEDINDYCVTQHLSFNYSNIAIICMDDCNMREIMKECIGDF